MPKSVLIVDDHEAVRRELRRLFRDYEEFSVCGEAQDGSETLTKAQQLLPDLIILDLVMPEMGGLEAATALHYMMPDVPIFLLTAHYSRELELTALQCGVRAIFSKYDDLGRLLHRARKELRVQDEEKIDPGSRNDGASQRSPLN